MSILPGLLQTTVVVLGLLMPALLFGHAAIPGLRRLGHRFRAAAFTVAGLLLIACLAIPGPSGFGDVIGVVLFLATAIVLSHAFWILLAWPFARAFPQCESPSACAENRLRLLFGTGIVTSDHERVVVSQTVATARLAGLVRFATGLGSSR